jgi:hypothetical protein
MPFGFDPLGGSSLTDVQAGSTLVSTQVPVDGVQASSAVGTVTFNISARAAGMTMAAAQSDLGLHGVSVYGNALVSGVQAMALLGPLGDLGFNGQRTVFVTSLMAQGAVDAVATSVPNLHINLTVAGLQATVNIGDITVAGVASAYPVPVDGVTGLCLLGDVAVSEGVTVTPLGVVGTMPVAFNIHAIVSTFGRDMVEAMPSQWEPVKPA